MVALRKTHRSGANKRSELDGVRVVARPASPHIVFGTMLQNTLKLETPKCALYLVSIPSPPSPHPQKRPKRAQIHKNAKGQTSLRHHPACKITLSTYSSSHDLIFALNQRSMAAPNRTRSRIRHAHSTRKKTNTIFAVFNTQHTDSASPPSASPARYQSTAAPNSAPESPPAAQSP